MSEFTGTRGECVLEIKPVTVNLRGGGKFADYQVMCKTHVTFSKGFASSDIAWSDFRCDPNRRLFLFVDMYSGEKHTGDMSELVAMIRGDYEDHAYGLDNYDYQYFEIVIKDKAQVVLEPIVIKSKGHDFDGNDYSYPKVWAEVISTGEKITETIARIDGRA